jgi:vancomycin resistance protein YoaR
VRGLVLLAVVCVVAAAVLGLAFAGSPAKLADGVHVAGVDVSGLTPSEARKLLEERAAALASVPVTFTVDGRRFELTPRRLGVKVDWAAAVAAARRQGEGFGPVRGFKRLQVRVFGADVAPPVQVYDAALRYEVGRISAAVARKPRDAALVLRGLKPVVVPARNGRRLDVAAADRVVVRALSAFARAPVALPMHRAAAEVSTGELRQAQRQARVALSAPVRVTLGNTRWRIPRWRMAKLLALPKDGRTGIAIGGSGAEEWFERVAKNVNRPAADATFAVNGTSVSVVPARDGYAIDVPETSSRLLAAATSRTGRTAQLAVATAKPKRSTEEAQRMGITTQISSYTTIYGGDPNRLSNVRLVAHLIDGAVVAPGAVFSFNGTTGERTADKGFLEAPVIINGELQTGLGGGVCQVSTTVFNAAYEAGLSIEERTNHALYISHYPLGRDATVNYPDLDLRFKNDTKRWLLVRTFVGESSLTVGIYGAPLHRRVESEASPLVTVDPPPVTKIPDPSLTVGQTVVEEYGEPSRRTSVTRRVFGEDGNLMYDTTWSSYYRSEPRVIRVGTKPIPKPEKEKPKPGTTTGTTPTDTAPTETTPTDTTPTTTEQVPPPAPGGGITDPKPQAGQ